MTQPLGVSTHRIGTDIPEQLEAILPTVEQLELELMIASTDLEEQRHFS